MSVGANVVPHFVKARTKEMLVRRMALIASRRGTYIKFRDIQKADGEWIAWYDSELKLKINNQENIKNGISKE